MPPKKPHNPNTFAVNRRARFDYELLQNFQAGVVLTGAEAKSIRAAHANVRESYVRFDRSGGLWLINAHVSSYQKHPGQAEGDPTRRRKLLLHKREIERLRLEAAAKGLTMVPLRLYGSRGRIKLEFALARGKKLYNRKEDKKRADIERETRRTLKSGRF